MVGAVMDVVKMVLERKGIDALKVRGLLMEEIRLTNW